MFDKKSLETLEAAAETRLLRGLLAHPTLKRARFALLGEATHGTHEFYALRAELSSHLIEDRGFRTVIVEADWPDMERVNRYVQHESDDQSADEALSDFERFPGWMWRNREFATFVDWMRDFNEDRDPNDRVGLYGMDLYSMERSLTRAVALIAEMDPELGGLARDYYSCFSGPRFNPQEYGQKAHHHLIETCADEVTTVLKDVQIERARRAQLNSPLGERDFSAEQNARIVANAERYYRSMFSPRDHSWNLRDSHMFDSVMALSEFRQQRTGSDKCLIWAHNSHLGDARATDQSASGEHNLGQLLRENQPKATFHLGFTTAGGQVIAAHQWDEPGRRRAIRPPLENSLENLLFSLQTSECLVDLTPSKIQKLFSEQILERAIGVIYRPETERWSHYFNVFVAKQFDALIHYDKTQSLYPLDELNSEAHESEMETFPTGL